MTPALQYSTSFISTLDKRLLWTFICPKAEEALLTPRAIVTIDASYKMAIGGKKDISNRHRDGYSKSFYQMLNVMVRIGEGVSSGWVSMVITV